MPPLYLSYLHLASSIREVNKSYRLTDGKQVMVLEAILMAYSQDKPFSMLDLVLPNEIASQVTLHSIAKQLIQLKLIQAHTSTTDARRKYIHPTKLGLSWLDDCAKVLSSLNMSHE
jgi:DNA-binding MarR family transcriptional regulator